MQIQLTPVTPFPSYELTKFASEETCGTAEKLNAEIEDHRQRLADFAESIEQLKTGNLPAGGDPFALASKLVKTRTALMAEAVELCQRKVGLFPTLQSEFQAYDAETRESSRKIEEEKTEQLKKVFPEKSAYGISLMVIEATKDTRAARLWRPSCIHGQTVNETHAELTNAQTRLGLALVALAGCA